MNLWNSCDLPVSTALELDSFPAKARCGASGHDARCRGSPCSRGPVPWQRLEDVIPCQGRKGPEKKDCYFGKLTKIDTQSSDRSK